MGVPEPESAARLVAAIHAGDADAIRLLVAEEPVLATDPLGGPFKTRTALHVVADWPGYFPNGPEVVRVLLGAGADPNARSPGDETPLHWAASSDDVDVAAALIDGGADIEAPDGSIGTPLDNAIGYSCWRVADLLAARGARVDKVWHAAALGMLDRLEHLLAANPSAEEVNQAFWHACAAGQRRAAERLLAARADLNWVPEYAREALRSTPPAAWARARQPDRLAEKARSSILRSHRARSPLGRSPSRSPTEGAARRRRPRN